MAPWQPVLDVGSVDLKSRPVISPHTNEVIDEVAYADVGVAERALDAAARDSSWASRPAPDRAERIYAWARLVEEASEEIAQLITGESGKPIRHARGEAAGTAAVLRYYAGLADKPIGESAPQVFQGLNMILREPVGTVVAIVPWNGPAYITAHKTAGALAGGNNVVVKPSPLASRSALRVCELAREAGIADAAVQCIPGDADVGQALVASDRAQGVTFTGSTETGRAVALAAAPTFKRLVLELGGKSPSLVFADADLEAAAASTAVAALSNSGQDCCARSRVFVAEQAHDAFVELLQAEVDRMVVGEPLREETDLGPLITPDHREYVESFLTRDACGADAHITGGTRPGGDDVASGNYLDPAIITGVSPRSRVLASDVFGPIFTVVSFADDEAGIAAANDTPYGLAASLWTADIDRVLTVVPRLTCGQVSVNGDSSVFMQLPFGGEKGSGLGREMGVRGMTNFLREKTVSIARRQPTSSTTIGP